MTSAASFLDHVRQDQLLAAVSHEIVNPEAGTVDLQYVFSRVAEPDGPQDYLLLFTDPSVWQQVGAPAAGFVRPPLTFLRRSFGSNRSVIVDLGSDVPVRTDLDSLIALQQRLNKVAPNDESPGRAAPPRDDWFEIAPGLTEDERRLAEEGRQIFLEHQQPDTPTPPKG